MVNVTYDDFGRLIFTDSSTSPPTLTTFNIANIAWVLAASALVWVMTPGVGFLYSGLLRRKNALSMIWLSMGTIAVASFQWFFWGFSLAFSDTGSPFIGDLQFFALRNLTSKPSLPSSGAVPTLIYCVYQMMFAIITPMLAIGSIAERGRPGPTLLFVFIWLTIVYSPVACWTWNFNGWSHQLGVLDFAGGTVVHISSGAAALAISVFLGKRKGYGTEQLAFKGHNTSYVVLGTVLMWVGWFGFNGGSALGANLRAAQAVLVTNIAASVGGLSWMLWDYIPHKKWSTVGFCSGAVSSLVAITPGAGFVGAPAAVAFGVVSGTICNFATHIREYFEWDDALDIFATHAVGGIIGNILTGFFAQASIAALDGKTVIDGGWLDHHYIQLGWQIANSVAGFGYSFVVTTIILHIMHHFPLPYGYSISLRDPEPTNETQGTDFSHLREFAYDYVDLEREIEPMFPLSPVSPNGNGNAASPISLLDDGVGQQVRRRGGGMRQSTSTLPLTVPTPYMLGAGTTMTNSQPMMTGTGTGTGTTTITSPGSVSMLS